MSFERDHARCRFCDDRRVSDSGRRTFRRFGFDSSSKHYERDVPFVVRHLACDWDLDVANKTLSGEVLLDVERIAKGTRELVLDAIAFELAAVTSGKKSLPYVYDGLALRITLPAAFERGVVRVAYSVRPQRGMLFLAPDEHVPTRPNQVWTQCQEEDARYFIPCHDAPHVKMTSEMRVRVPRGWTALSNGELLSERKRGKKSEFHYAFSEPHSSYLLTLVAGDFASYTEKVRSGERDVALRYLYPQGRDHDAKATFAATPRMLAFFSERFGVPYPWASYAQAVVADFPGGGMENTTATTLYEHTLLDDAARLDVTADELVAHELAHQWFGDLVTCRSWSEGWLNEGFATYSERLWDEHERGADEAMFGLQRDLSAYLAESARYVRPVVSHTYDAPYDLFDRHLYEKGGVFLHGLREELGDVVFFTALRTYLVQHARGLVETRDLLRVMEASSGKSLSRRFDEGLYTPGHPVLRVTIQHERGLLSIHAKQLQKASEARDGERGVPEVFAVPLRFDILRADGTLHTECVSFERRQDTFVFALPERPLAVIVDPRMTVLGELTVDAPHDLLHAQLEHAPTARGRWLAARALASLGDSRTLARLVKRVRDEREFWGVRVECAEALGAARNEESKRALLAALSLEHPKVRRAVVRALGSFRVPEVVAALTPIALSDESIVVQAEAARSLGRTKQASSYDTLVVLLGRTSWADVVAVGAIEGLLACKDERAIEHVAARTKYGYSSRIRRAATKAVPGLLPAARARELLEGLLADPDQNLRIDVAYALAELDDARARGALQDQLQRDLDPRARRAYRDVLRDLGKDKGKADMALQADVARLEKMLGELHQQVGVLQARTKTQKPARRSPRKR